LKNKKKWIGFAAIVAVIGFAFSACTFGSDDDGTAYAIGDTGPNNKDDWFLPSKDELNEMFKARKHLGISTGDFWSSSQERDSSAWGQSFMNGNQWQNGKNETRYFRPIRAF